MNKTPLSIVWLRRDLRLEENTALFHALKQGTPVLPLFIFDAQILQKLPKQDARVSFIHQQLQTLNTQLAQVQSSIMVAHGDPLAVFTDLVQSHAIEAVYANHDYEPYAIQRDTRIAQLLEAQNIPMHTFKDQVIYEKQEIVKTDGSPYKVYTPYSKRWIQHYQDHPQDPISSESYLEQCVKIQHAFPSLESLGFEPSTQAIAPFRFHSDLINQYEAKRNFPALPGTSRLGTHLRFGTVGIRTLVQDAFKADNRTFLKELIWREFFMQILWHFPQTVSKAFKPIYDRIQWRNNEEEFHRWCQGQTGYPLVDAGMRELNATGFMHNRVRMVTASFLCKHLLIDWRWGEAYFAEKLHDYDQASNVGNWQWVAGCGVDAAPYFRIFNPTSQFQKFDKEHRYVSHWVPEYQELTYPKPMVVHSFARERCLKTYKAVLDMTNL